MNVTWKDCRTYTLVLSSKEFAFIKSAVDRLWSSEIWADGKENLSANAEITAMKKRFDETL